VAAETSPGQRKATASADPEPLEEIEARLLKLERRSAAAQALGDYAKALATGQHDAGVAAEAQGPVNPDNPVFELAVRSVVDKVEWEKREEERVERQNRRLERAEIMSSRLAQKLALNGDQRARVTQVFVEAMEALRNLRAPSDPNAPAPPRGDWRTRSQEIRKQSDAKLREILDQGQFTAYQDLVEKDEELRWWARFSRGGADQRPRASP
jgi:hypothetical protein